MFPPATTTVCVIHCGINDIQEASAHAYGPHEIAENVILYGSKLKERHPRISVIIMGILPAVETFRGRNSQIEQVNYLLEKGCESCGFLFVSQAGCWRDLDTGDINQSLYWRDGLHLNKKGCNMLSKIYAESIDSSSTTKDPSTKKTYFRPKGHSVHLHSPITCCYATCG